MAAQNLYNDSEESTAPVQDRQSVEDSDEPTTIIPKSLLAGKHFEVSDEICLEIVAIHGDEIEVRYSTKGEGEGESDGASDSGSMDEEMPMPKSRNGNPNYY